MQGPNVLNETFQQKWIGLHGPNKGPDLISLDIFYWGCFKNTLFSKKQDSRYCWKGQEQNVEVATSILSQILRNENDECYKRLDYCLAIKVCFETISY